MAGVRSNSTYSNTHPPRDRAVAMVQVVTLGNNASSGDRGLNLAELEALAKYKNKSKVEFPDDDYPLKTSNAETQKEISKRISNRMKEVRLKNKDLAQLWETSPATVTRRKQDPGKMDFYECEKLRDKLGCSIEWLRHGGAIDTLSTEELIFLYDGLDQSDREIVSSLVRRLAGEEAIKEMDTVSLGRRTYFYLERHPEESEKINEMLDSLKSSLDYQLNAIRVASKKFAESVRPTYMDEVISRMRADVEREQFVREHLDSVEDVVSEITQQANVNVT